MPDDKYSLIGLVTLEAGSWADWFSGSMSLAAVGAAFFGYWTVHRQRVQDDRDRDKHAAESVGWKVIKVFNDTATIAKHFKQSLEKDADLTFRKTRFSRVQPLGVPPPVYRGSKPRRGQLVVEGKSI